MRILGLILSIIFIISLIGTIAIYIAFFIKKKYKYSNMIMPIIFLESLVILMGMTWSLVLMNGGFNVNCYLQIDYTYLILGIIPIFIILIVMDIRIQRSTCRNLSTIKRIMRYILPALTILLLFMITISFYFNINYFIYLNM